MVYLDRLLIGSLITMAAVTFYTAPYEVVTRLWVIPLSLAMTLFPAFSTLEGIGDRHRMGVLFARSIKYTLLALGPIVVLLVLFAKEALQIWLGGDFPSASSTVLRWLAVGVFINSLAHVPYALLQGIGRPDITAKFHLLELPIYVGIAWFSIPHWGIAGVGAAWTLRATLDAILLFLASFKLCPFPSGLLRARDLKLSILALSVLVGIAYGAKILTEGLPLGFQIFLFAAIFTLFSGLGWKNLLDESDREMIFKMIRRSPRPEKIP
jgi:O-antigen/teichoic acid export membrane protein